MDNSKEIYVNFHAPIVPQSAGTLMKIISDLIQKGCAKITIAISSRGGDVSAGISLYNFLKGVPVEIETHNYGAVDSIAIVVFCAGKKRYCVPHARFLMHGVGFNVPGSTRFEEKILDEKLKDIKIDKKNIASVIAENCKKTIKQISDDMHEVKTLDANEAKEYDLVNEIKSELFPKGSQVITIDGPWQVTKS